MSKTQSALRILPMPAHARDLSYSQQFQHVTAVDDTHAATLIHEQQISTTRSLNLSSKQQKVFNLSTYDKLSTADFTKTLFEDFGRVLNGEDLSFIFVENENGCNFPDSVQFCYCPHSQKCLVESFIEYVESNLYNQSIIQLDTSFDIFENKQHETKTKIENELIKTNIIPKQPMYPQVILKNLALIQKNAINQPSILQIDLLLNKFALNSTQKSKLQIILIPKIQFDYKKEFALHNKKPVDDISVNKLKFNQNLSNYSLTQSQLCTHGHTLADQIKHGHCKCLYQQKSHYVLTQNADPKFNERIRDKPIQLIPFYDREKQFVNNRLFTELQTVTFQFVNQVPCYLDFTSPFIDCLKPTLSGKSYSKMIVFAQESDQQVDQLLRVAQNFRQIANKQKWNKETKKDYVTIDKEEYELLKQAAAQRGQVQAQYAMLEQDARSYFKVNQAEKGAYISRIEALKAREKMLENQLDDIKLRVKLTKQMGIEE
ncbi:Conserved_hypothetical protein [Hexamita inflata]|uniref:Uncharacterized protein n=1 Tax=Hexamita inflata TaxID=28002 RepID=A0AA86RMI2_9EUKA|nr:Conserved hypothetical protein [Hexamita inflata]